MIWKYMARLRLISTELILVHTEEEWFYTSGDPPLLGTFNRENINVRIEKYLFILRKKQRVNHCLTQLRSRGHIFHSSEEWIQRPGQYVNDAV